VGTGREVGARADDRIGRQDEEREPAMTRATAATAASISISRDRGLLQADSLPLKAGSTSALGRCGVAVT
jgi:hypothetical protein